MSKTRRIYYPARTQYTRINGITMSSFTPYEDVPIESEKSSTSFVRGYDYASYLPKDEARSFYETGCMQADNAKSSLDLICAINTFELALEKCSPYNKKLKTHIFKVKAAVHSQLDHYRSVIQCYKNVPVNDYDGLDFAILGKAYKATHHDSEALECIQKALASDEIDKATREEFYRIRAEINHKINQRLQIEEEEKKRKLTFNELMLTANIYQAEGDHAMAISYYNDALEIYPENAIAWNNKAFSHNQLHDFSEAKSSAKRAIELDGKMAYPWRHLGNAYVGLTRYHKALPCYDKALELNDNYLEAQLDRNRCLEKLDEIKQQARELYVDAKVLSYQGKHEEAISIFDKALKLQPDDFITWSGKAYEWNALQQYANALQCCNESIRINAYFSDAWLYRGNAYFGLKQYNKALECYDKTLALKPNDPIAKSARIECRKLIGKFKIFSDLCAFIEKKVTNYIDNNKTKIKNATILGFTFFYHVELSKEKEKLALYLLSELKNKNNYEEIMDLLNNCIDEDARLAGLHDKNPATFTQLLKQLYDEVTKFNNIPKNETLRVYNKLR